MHGARGSLELTTPHETSFPWPAAVPCERRAARRRDVSILAVSIESLPRFDDSGGYSEACRYAEGVVPAHRLNTVLKRLG
jgi:hypothetical protein